MGGKGNKKSKKEMIEEGNSGSENNNNNNNEDTKKEKEDGKEAPAAGPAFPPVPYTQLFRYASSTDKLLIIIGVLAAAASGITMPGMIILFGQITDSLVQANSDVCKSTGTPSGSTTVGVSQPTTTVEATDDFLEKIANLALYQTLLGIGQAIVGYFFITCFNIISENVTYRIRQKYLEALLRQNVGWYDTNQDRNFVSRIAEDGMKIQDAIGEKLGLCIFFLSTSLFALGSAFYHGWLLSLVVLSIAPVLAIASGIVSTIQSRLAATEQTAYAKAGTVAEEAITNIRTVFAFSGQSKEIERYEKGLETAQAAGKQRGAVSGFGMGLVWLIMYAGYALAFWYGTKLILDGQDKYCEDGTTPDYTAENLLIVFFNVLIGAFNIGQSASYLEAFAVGRGSAAGIYAVIDRSPEIDSYSEAGQKPKNKATGRIKFENVKFNYPSRPEVQILNGFSLSIEPEQTIALVGHSGCGKSTCLQLLQRFYDPTEGNVSVDGFDIKDLNLGWLRSQIGIVSQEPVLFNATIAENIRFGRDDVTQKEVEEACRQANAHQFISKLPDGYNTPVGDRGAQLSGGQKQRVAIARALVRNPSILLLDEATSALDTQSESVVQAALDRARKGRTTLIVAHRLSTIRAADLVVSLSDGQVSEKGNHQELLKNKGLYFQLVTAQMNSTGELDDDTDLNTEVDEYDPSRRQSARKSIPVDEEEIVTVPIVSEDSLSESELEKQAPLRRLLTMNMPEWKWMLTGVISAMIHGAIFPVYAIIFGEFLGVLGNFEVDQQAEANKYALYFVGIGIIAGLSMFIQMFSFSFAGEALTKRLRKLAFEAMLKQEAGWYDDPSNNIGALCARLSGDASSVQGATGSHVGSLVQSLSTIGLAIILSLYYSPRLGAVALAFAPLVGFMAFLGGGLLHGQNIKEKQAVENSSKVAVQAVANIRTVASLCKERTFVRMYEEALSAPHSMIVRRSHVRGLIFGFSQALPLFAFASVLYYGAYLNEKGDLEYKEIFKVTQALLSGTMTVGQALSFAPNFTKAKVAGARILRLLDRRPAIDNSPGVGLQINNAQGSVIFDKVAFSYPTRPSAKILRGLTAGFAPGKKVAIVGPSGSGKSTCIQLILRFYDPLTGQVKLDEVDVAALNVDALRSQMAIVAQEPALFDRTLAENIAYGDNSRSISMDEIIKAARMANIHSFINGLPAGYETRVGEMGTQLSGGQKQRVAIARALVRNPKVLLLDEATSALDMESEQVVQAALETASEGRTSITIAHRLASIQNVDTILVINNGSLTESGTHQELLQRQGIYHRLWNMQGSGNQRKNPSSKDD